MVCVLFPAAWLPVAAATAAAAAVHVVVSGAPPPPNPAINSIDCLRPDGTRAACGPGNEQCGAPFPQAPRYHVMDPSCRMNVRAQASCHTYTCAVLTDENWRCSRTQTVQYTMPSTESFISSSRTTSQCHHSMAVALAQYTGMPRLRTWLTGRDCLWRYGMTTVTTASLFTPGDSVAILPLPALCAFARKHVLNPLLGGASLLYLGRPLSWTAKYTSFTPGSASHWGVLTAPTPIALLVGTSTWPCLPTRATPC